MSMMQLQKARHAAKAELDRLVDDEFGPIAKAYKVARGQALATVELSPIGKAYKDMYAKVQAARDKLAEANCALANGQLTELNKEVSHE
jgi:hypothetical protein